MNSVRSTIAVSLLYLCSSLLFGQNPSQYQLNLKKDFISWVWLAHLETSVKTGQRSRLSFSDQYTSSLFRQTAQIDKWRDENTLAIYWDQPLSVTLQTRSLLESRIFSDENASREFNKHLLAQELTLNLHSRVRLKPALGLALEEAFDNQDEGWYARLGLEISRLSMGEYLNYTDLNSVIRAFPGRKNQEHTFFTGWTTRFSEYASDSLRLGYQFSESRYYIQPTASLPNPREQVIINGRFLFNQLQYRISDRSLLNFITSFKNRDIDQSNPTLSSRRDEFTLENQFQYLILWETLQIENSIFFSQSRNDNPGVDTDINSLQSAFNTTLRYRPSPHHLLWGKFSYTKLEYNTPDVVDENSNIALRNRQDRDEQRFIIDTGYRHRFSPYFTLQLKGNIYLYHQIYLRAGRSQNNNWNRIFQLSGAFEHQMSDYLRHGHQLKILANYTAFDFEELLPQVRSFVFRKLIYSDSLTVQLSEDLSLIHIYQWEKEDNGTFFQEQFSQQVTRELTAHFFNLNLQHREVFGLTVTAGMTLFLRDEWAFTPQRDRRRMRKYRSFTPRLTVVYPASRRLLLYLSYAPNRSSNATRSLSAANFTENVQYFTSGNINLRYMF